MIVWNQCIFVLLATKTKPSRKKLPILKNRVIHLVDDTFPTNIIKSTNFCKMVANKSIIDTILDIVNEKIASVNHIKQMIFDKCA